MNKETKVRNIGLLFAFYYYSYLENIIQTFNRTNFFCKQYQLQKLKQKKYVRRIPYMIKQNISNFLVSKLQKILFFVNFAS